MKLVTILTPRRWVLIAASLVVALTLGALIRYGVLANEAQALMCRETPAAGWCFVRSALGLSIHFQVFGLGGLLLGIAAWLPRLRFLAIPGLFLAGCGLFIYNTFYAAVAVVVTLLAAVQPSGRTG